MAPLNLSHLASLYESVLFLGVRHRCVYVCATLPDKTLVLPGFLEQKNYRGRLTIGIIFGMEIQSIPIS